MSYCKFSVGILLLVILHSGSVLRAAILENAFYRVEITEDWSDTHPPGSLLEFYKFEDPEGDALAGMDYAGLIEAGGYTVYPGIFEYISSAEGIFISPLLASGNDYLNARTTLHYTLTERGLKIDWRIDCDEPVSFDNGLNWEWDLSSWSELKSYNQYGLVEEFDLPLAGGAVMRSLRTGWKLRNDDAALWILQPNPLQSTWLVDSGDLTQQWLHSRVPNTTLNTNNYPRIASRLSPEHSIWGTVQLEISPPDNQLPGGEAGWIFLSGMPDMAEQGMMFLYDEAPMPYDLWNIMTTPNDPDAPVGSAIVALLENHPQLKQILLLGMDKILSGYPFCPSLPWWSVPQSFVCVDTLDQQQGSAAMTITHYINRDTWVTQTLGCNQNETLQLSGWIRVDSIASGRVGVQVTGADLSLEPPEFQFYSPTGWVFCQTEFNTGNSPSVTVKLGMEANDASAAFDDILLNRPGQTDNMLVNGNFDNYTLFTWYDGEGTEWWHAHQYRHLAVEAPEEYRNWLQLLESGQTDYGWEDRFALGMHCYHHTPNELFPLGGDNTHEFNLYDPYGDSARFYMINHDLQELGLTGESFEVFRFAGHRHQLPTVIECIKSGVKLIDRGPNYEDNCLLAPIIQPEGVIWETNTGWWADYNDWIDPACVYAVLERGELVLGGGHPSNIFPPDLPEQFDVIDGIFTEMGTRFPHQKYFFPGDYADFCEQSRTWHQMECVHSPNLMELYFFGTASEGQTAVVYSTDELQLLSTPLVDGQPAQYDQRGNRIFVQLPELDLGYHVVSVSISTPVSPDPPAQLPMQIELGTPFPNPTNAWVSFPLELPYSTSVEYTISDILGRALLRDSVPFTNGSRRLSLHLNDLPSGVYFYQLRAGDTRQHGRFTLLK